MKAADRGAFLKVANTYKGKLVGQSDTDLHTCCWAANHNGRAKAKKYNKRVAKKRLRREWRREAEQMERMTIYEKIKSLSKEDMAHFLAQIQWDSSEPTYEEMYEYLSQPYFADAEDALYAATDGRKDR